MRTSGNPAALTDEWKVILSMTRFVGQRGGDPNASRLTELPLLSKG